MAEPSAPRGLAVPGLSESTITSPICQGVNEIMVLHTAPPPSQKPSCDPMFTPYKARAVERFVDESPVSGEPFRPSGRRQ
ncbi:hypothetical protein PAXRUDRAFT_823878 [Paxillus rubicundulus Ve08.2h10]|uniref:Uncharacterized protein n=1 Tax=Paxillus rubicundulus Ve08.2h10 TaxID=930991 RepID=A0A0D0DJC7_9AGAM|nr:hypothetical protein PAXRUDRAFT_823878 [Paxillus rubicundulus Ve08.2h10]